MVKKKRRVLEIVEFKLKPSYGEEQIKRASDKANEFIELQPGFEHRMLLNSKAKWFEFTQWRNDDYAKDARKKIKESEECKDMIGMISPVSVKITHPELIQMY